MRKEVLIRTLWTLAEAGAGMGITYLSGISAWWALPIAGLLTAFKVNVLDKEASGHADE